MGMMNGIDSEKELFFHYHYPASDVSWMLFLDRSASLPCGKADAKKRGIWEF
jgi:hypothetical protein